MRRLTLIALFLVTLAAPALVPSAAEAGIDGLIASASICPNQTDPRAPVAVQERAMRCLTNFARRRAGLGALAPALRLSRAAAHKAGDILRCNEFSHEACGHEFSYWMQRFGYLGGGCWRAAENIAWGSGRLGTVRWVFVAWMHSAGHRENLLGPYAQIGIGLRTGGLEGNSRAHVWVVELGSHTC